MVGVDGQLGQRVGQLAPRRCGWGGGATRHTPRAPTVSPYYPVCVAFSLCVCMCIRMFSYTTVGSQLSLTYLVWEFVVVVPASKSGFNLVENLSRRPGLPASLAYGSYLI